MLKVKTIGKWVATKVPMCSELLGQQKSLSESYSTILDNVAGYDLTMKEMFVDALLKLNSPDLKESIPQKMSEGTSWFHLGCATRISHWQPPNSQIPENVDRIWNSIWEFGCYRCIPLWFCSTMIMFFYTIKGFASLGGVSKQRYTKQRRDATVIDQK